MYQKHLKRSILIQPILNNRPSRLPKIWTGYLSSSLRHCIRAVIISIASIAMALALCKLVLPGNTSFCCKVKSFTSHMERSNNMQLHYVSHWIYWYKKLYNLLKYTRMQDFLTSHPLVTFSTDPQVLEQPVYPHYSSLCHTITNIPNTCNRL